MTDEKRAFPNGGDWEYFEDMDPPAGARQEKETPLTPDQIAETRVYNLPDEKGREKTPKAFLLTRSEAKLLYKASIINVDTWTRLLLNEARPGAIGNAVDQETILQELEQAWKEQDVSISKLQKIYKKVDASKYWNYRTAYLLIPPEEDEGQDQYETTTVIFINKTVHRSFPYEGGRGYQIVQAGNPVEGAKLAEVPEGIKYLPVSEYMALDDLRTIVKALADKDKEGLIIEKPNLDTWPNSPVIDVFAEVGRQSINKATQGELAFTGEGTRKITSAKGVKIITTSVDDAIFLSLAGDADRVLKIFTKEATKDPDKNNLVYEIPTAEVARRIGLKSARELTRKIYLDGATEPTTRAEMITDEIGSVSLEWKHKNKVYFFKGRLTSATGVLPRKGRGGSVIRIELSPNYKAHILNDTTGLYQIPDNITEIRNDNAYRIAVELFKAYRMNVGKDTEGIISVKTLLKVTDWVTYEELGKDRRNAPQRIIAPFKNCLLYLEDIEYLQDWDFYYEGTNTRISEEDFDRASKDYNFFSGLQIHYVINPKYRPDYTNLIKGRAKQRKIAEKAKAKKAQEQGAK